MGSDQLRFEVANASQARWGCLSGVHIGGDPQPTENGALRAGDVGTPLWRLTATSCNTSFPAAALALDSCTVACAHKYLVTRTAAVAHMRWEHCTAADGYSLPNTTGHRATLDIDVTVTVVGGTSTWTGTIGKQHAAGVCLQCFALPSMESLRFTPDQEELKANLPRARHTGTPGNRPPGIEALQEALDATKRAKDFECLRIFC